jgi:hypothetical protein
MAVLWRIITTPFAFHTPDLPLLVSTLFDKNRVKRIVAQGPAKYFTPEEYQLLVMLLKHHNNGVKPADQKLTVEDQFGTGSKQEVACGPAKKFVCGLSGGTVCVAVLSASLAQPLRRKIVGHAFGQIGAAECGGSNACTPRLFQFCQNTCNLAAMFDYHRMGDSESPTYFPQAASISQATEDRPFGIRKMPGQEPQQIPLAHLAEK